MSLERTWQRYRHWLYDAPDGLRVDVSRMDLPDDYDARMSVAFETAFRDMRALEEGGIANPDEQRRVGHYWLRAPRLAPETELTEAIERTCDRIVEFAARVHGGELRPERGDRFTDLLLIGIGGSALGPQLVADALGGAQDRMAPHFIDNTDPDGTHRVLAGLDLERTLTIVVSKSGGTAETRNGMVETAAAYGARGLDFAAHAVAVTQEGSKLDLAAREQGFVERFPMWDWVGGRTSVLSAVGLLPAALQGLDVQALLDGAARMDEATRVGEVRRNPAALLALAWHHAGRGRGARDMVVLPYRDRLALFSRYLQQLVMESLGKELDLEGRVVHQGLTVYGNKGSTDQHAYVQQLRDGLPNFFVTFVQVLDDGDDRPVEVEPGITSGDFLHGFLLGTRAALHERERPSMTVTLRRLDADGVGRLIALYERAVGLYASLIRVNAYHQPGVEAGKRAAALVLELQRRVVETLREHGTDGAGAEELALELGVEDVETVFHILEHLSANASTGVRRKPADPVTGSTYVFV